MRAERLPQDPAEAIDRSKRITFSLERRRIQAYEGDTVGSAMAAAGVEITARSFKYHRPRGQMCFTGSCPGCLCRVDGEPNVRACVTPAGDGMRVERQNGRPSVERDVQGILNRFSFMMPAGFYYKIFHKPKWVWPKVEPIIRRVAGVGRLPDSPDHGHHEKVHLHPDVLVIGGGAAGLAAAVEAARAGARTTLLEERHELGGRLRSSTEIAEDPSSGEAGVAAPELARRLIAAAREAGVELLTATPAFGSFEGPLIGAANGSALYRIRPRRIVFATGAVEQPAVFANNDLPGVMLAGGVDRLVNLYRVLPGKRAVVLALGPEAYRTAASLAEAGAAVTVVDPSKTHVELARGVKGTVISGSTILRAIGKRHVTAVEVGSVADAPVGETSPHRIACDLVVVGGMFAPTTNLLAQAGVKTAWDEAAGAFLPVDLPDGMAAAGEAAGIRDLKAIVAHGRLAGAEAARAAGGGEATHAVIAELRALDLGPAARTLAPVKAPVAGGKQFACFCMDVTDKELRFAVREGFDSVELLKRYTTLSMGPCQGKACLTSSVRLCAQVTRRTIAETGTPTARPPWTPVSMRTFASEGLVPRKESSMHDRHADLGAELMWAGDWRRARNYIDPPKEAAAIHTNVALIDVSSLGKFRAKGPDVVGFLERIYPNRFGDLKVGRIRYGVTLNDSGVILDDGTLARLDDDEYFITTTTSGTGSMLRWMRWWLAVWSMDVQLLNVSGQFGAVNLTGPRSREVMARVTDMDVSAEAMPYLSCTQGPVAGVPAMVLRIGFTGELGYEIHFPSAYGEHVWDSILEAGRDEGIQPFGLEAQRIVRLEKQHILVGQDTDALSDPFGAGMPWIVKMDKPDFLGRQALAELLTAGPPIERLVGWSSDDGVVPKEGSAIVLNDTWVGRVTSARDSGAVGKVIGMGWVPASLAAGGTPLEIRFDGMVVRATVHLEPFYDPDGARLRS